jgi:hypothetical protein
MDGKNNPILTLAPDGRRQKARGEVKLFHNIDAESAIAGTTLKK